MEKQYLDKLFFSDDLSELKVFFDKNIISVNAVNDFGENALWFSLNNIDKINFLIKEGINIHQLTTNKQNILFSMSLENYLLTTMEYDHNIKRTVLDNTEIERKYNELLIRNRIRNKIEIKTQNTKLNNEKLDNLAVFVFNGFNYPDVKTREELLKLFKSKGVNINQLDIYEKNYKNYLNSENEVEFYSKILDKNR